MSFKKLPMGKLLENLLVHGGMDEITKLIAGYDYMQWFVQLPSGGSTRRLNVIWPILPVPYSKHDVNKKAFFPVLYIPIYVGWFVFGEFFKVLMHSMAKPLPSQWNSPTRKH